MYLQSAKRFVNEVLEQTNHDVLLSTNNLGFFNDVISERFFLRNNIDESSILMYNSEFNYNLKYHAFKDIPINYDVIIYLDCDIIFKPETLALLINGSKTIDNEYYIISPQTPKLWDWTWDVLVNQLYQNEQYGDLINIFIS